MTTATAKPIALMCHICGETRGSFRIVDLDGTDDYPEGRKVCECLSHSPKLGAAGRRHGGRS